ncbi:MAG: hypothetical protein MUC33_19930, partial [Desulfobacterales bacterium]|nr:hypothetical protein [Desulfobacterales bacterium]
CGALEYASFLGISRALHLGISDQPVSAEKAKACNLLHSSLAGRPLVISFGRIRVDLGLQAVAVFIEDKIHAPLGAARFLEKAAAGLLLLAGRRAEGNVLGPAEIDHRPTDHAGLPLPLASRGKSSFLYKTIATPARNLR